MSEDLFSYSNTGEPKYIVSEFVEEVEMTLFWVTEEAMRLPSADDNSFVAKESYDKRFERKVRKEKHKLLSSLIHATLYFVELMKDEDTRASESSCNLSVSSDRSTGSNDNLTADSNSLPAFHREAVLAFLKRARAAYGRTALCLSGGAMMALYHFGHVVGLLEAGVLPHIISGTSGGSVVGAILCTRTDDELRRDLKPEILASKLTCFARPWSERIKSVFRNGHMFDFDEWMDLIQW